MSFGLVRVALGVKGSLAGGGGDGEGVSQPHSLCLCVWEEQEPREDAIGTFHAQQGVLVCGLQEDVLPFIQLEDHAARGDLEGALDVIAEGDHLLHALPAPHEVHAQVSSRAGVVGEVVNAGHAAGELATSRFVVAVLVGDHVVEADGLVPPQDTVDGPRGGEGDFLCGPIVP